MVAGIRLRSRDQTFDFCDFLRDKPHLRPLVRSIVVDPVVFAPVPLLRILPNVCEIKLTSRKPILALHQSSLTCFRLLGTHIHTLHLAHLSFDNYLQFARVLLAFTDIVHLTFTRVKIAKGGNPGHVALLRQRLSKRLRLKILAIDATSVTGGLDTCASIYGWFDSDLASSTVESLKLVGLQSPGKSCLNTSDSQAWSQLQSLLSKRPDWSQLRSLVLRISSLPQYIPTTIKLLENFHSPVLKEVLLELFTATSITALIRPLTLLKRRIGASVALSEEDQHLERALLRFPQSRIVWIMQTLRANRLSSSWNLNSPLGWRFPALYQHARLVVKAEEVLPTGHDACITALVISANCMWVASGSEDFTIIIWDMMGNIVRQWVAHNYTPIRSLAFSPDSRYLLSGGEDGTTMFWDLEQSAYEPTGTAFNLAADIHTMAWSPTAAIIAFGFWDGTVQLWDTHSFRQLHVLLDVQNMMARGLAFSPDGRWLVLGIPPWNYCIWDVQSGTLNQYIRGSVLHFGVFAGPAGSTVAAFDPTSTRLASLSGDDVEIWDIETKLRLSLLRYAAAANDISFSPDGKLVLVALADRTVSCSNVYTGEQILQLSGHTERVMNARFSPCGKYIASASWDRTVRLWKTSDGSQVAKFSVSERDEWVELFLAFSADGKTLVSGGMDGALLIRHMHDIISMVEESP